MTVPEHTIQGLRKEDRSAQEAVYSLLFSDSFKIAMRYTRSSEEARDVLNVAFFKALTKIESFRGDGSNFFGWFKRILINQSLDHLKASNFRQSFVPLDELQEAYAHEDPVGEKDDYENVIALIQRLPDTAKCVFNLYAIDGYSHREIARELGITEDNSRYHLHSARKQLKAWIFKTERS